MIDSHCHLSYPDFNADRDAMMQRARDVGAQAFVSIATGPEDWQPTLDIAETRADVFVAMGIHPNEAGCFNESTFAALSALSRQNKKVVAIGETGLDFYRDNAPHDKQFAAFQAQLNLAEELQKPFVLHCRAAENEMLEVLEKHRAKTGRPLNGIWHCFTASKIFVEPAVKLGLLFGLGGVLTYPKAIEVREAAALLPDECILLETDCPFLPPQPWRGKRNEPAYLDAVIDKLAEVRGSTPEKIRALTTKNARKLFGI